MSKKVLTEAKIRVLEKDLDYAPIQNEIIESKFFTDWMRLQWDYRNKPTPYFNNVLSFTPKSLWKPHEAVLRDLKEALDNTESGTISTQNLVKLAEFVLKNHYYEFKGKVKQ